MAVQTPKKTSALPWPALLPLGHHAGKPAISLQKMVMLVGSRHNAHLHLLSRHVSKAHALILSNGGRVYIRDLASREQVYINGVPEREAWLTEGDLIKIGSFTFKYKAGPGMTPAPDAPPEQANLEIAGAEAPLAIAEKVMLIGRRSTCDISLVEDSVSTAHAVIFHVGGKRYIRDLGSRTGTFVNGHKVHQHALEPDDTILIGDTEMRYALASEHDHAITPADVEVEPIDEMDELEDLVGTAPLDMEAEIERDGQVLPAELELQTEAAEEAPAAPKDDLIELEIAHEPPARPAPAAPRAAGKVESPAPAKAAPPIPVAGGAPKAPTRPQPEPQPVMNEPIELEPLELEPVAEAPVPAPAPAPVPAAAPREDVKAGAGLPIDDELDRLMNVPEPVEPELVEIDLSTDPDVSDLPNAADTHAIGMEFQQPPVKPTLSANVVDGPIELEPVAEAPAEPAGAPAAEAAGVTPAADETKLDATWGDEVLPPGEADTTTTTGEVEEISPRGGWQGMSRAEEEEIEVLTAQGTTPEEAAPVGEAPAIEAPVADVPASEVPGAGEPVAEAPAAEVPVVEVPVTEAPVELTPVEEPLDLVLPVDEAPAAETPVDIDIAPAADAKQKKGRKPKAEKKPRGGRKSKAIEEVAAESSAALPVEEVLTPEEAPAETPAVAEAPAAEGSNLEAPAPLEIEPVAPAMEIAGQVEPLEGAATQTGEGATPLEVTADRAIPVEEPVEGEMEASGEGRAEMPAEPVAEVLPPDVSEVSAEVEEELAPIDIAPAEEAAIEAAPVAAQEEPVAPTVDAEVAAPETAAPAEQMPGGEASAKSAEPTEELSTLEEDDLGIAAAFLPEGESAKGDDIFSGVDEALPVLELDAADLGPAAGSRDPDALLATEESLGDVEVIERTEPTPSSAFDLDLDSGGEPTAEIEEPSLTDSTFGRQVEAFTTTSSGDIVEEDDDLDNLPELEAVPDPDEELALILGTDEAPGGLASGETGDTTVDVTAGGIDPAASGVVSEEHLTDQQFGAEGEAVLLETPGLAEADAVLGGQSFVVDAEGHELDEEVQAVEEPSPLDEQSFVAEGEAHAAEQGGAAAVAQAPTQGEPAAPQRPSNGDGGNFVIGTDLSSFIGGMPLVLPDLAPPPTAFGQVQVSFAGAKAPWEQAKRPSFPMGQSLAQEVTDAAEGLRDVEEMEEEAEPEPQAEAGEYDEEDDLGEGAPGDEWNVAAAFEDDEEGEPVAGQWPGAGGAVSEEAASEDASLEEAAVEETALEEMGAEESALEELPAEAEHELEAGQSQTDIEPVELNVHAAPETIEELQPQPVETPFDHAEDESAAGFLELDESESHAEGEMPAALDEDDLMQELALDDGAVVPEPERPAAEDLGAVLDEAGHVDTEHVDEGIPPLDLSVAPEPPAPVAPATPPVAKPVAPAVEAPAAPAKPAQPAMVVPPPPARSLRGRKGAEPPTAAPAAPAAPVSLTGDSIFGSMEHGNLDGGAFGGGVREVDVFSQGSIGLGDARRAPAAMEGVEGRRPQRAIVPPRMGVLGAGAAAIENESGEPLTRPAYRVIRKKSAAKTVFVVLLIMLVVMGLAIAGIFYFFHPPQTLRGKLHFEHTGALTKLQRDELRKAEFAKLVTPRILLEARTNVAAQSIPAGFLSDPEQFARGVKPEWVEEQPDVMTVSYTGPADPNDRRRLYALLLSMYEDSHADLDRERQLNANIAKLEKQIQQIQQDRAERDRLKKIVDASPDPAQVKQLEAAAHQADTAYDAAVAAVKDAQLEVKRAETQIPAGEKSSAASASSKGAAGDPQLRDLQKQLQETASQIASMKSAASEEADAKRKELDQAIERFQATAAEIIKESPQLAQYVQAVQQLQEQTHKLSGELIDVQQQQHKRLSAIKKDIDDRMQARRVELWAADKTLSDLNAQLDLAQRKYNAAIDLNYAVDSKDVKEALAEIRDLSTKIEARKQTLGNDPIVTSVADALQDMINVTKERLEVDRKRIEKDIKDQESAFAQSNMVEKLPDTQRAQAAALKAKQEAINGLRREYAAALDKRTTDSNNALRNLEAQVSTLNSQIDERKRQLASDSSRKLTAEEEAQRKAALAQKQGALKEAEDRAAVAREAYAKASRALTAAMSQTGDQTAARQKLEAIDQGWQQKEAEERQAQLSLEANKDQLKTLVTIGKPSESNIEVVGSRDDRLLYSLGVAVALAVVFGAIAVFSVSGGEGRLQQPPEGEADEFDPDAEAGPLAIHEIGRHGRRAKPQAANMPVEGV